MLKRNKGISMVSLVIIIIVTIILVGVVVAGGYNYIIESENTKKAALTSMISEAAYRLQEDQQAGIVSAYYAGYSIPSTFNKVNYVGLPDDVDPSTTEGFWYILDADSTKALGVVDADKFLEKDITAVDPSKKQCTVALVNYENGDTYIIKTTPAEAVKIVEEQICSGGGTHAYSVQTCTEGSKCIKCGLAQVGHENALGHNWIEATCTSPATCKRCGLVDESKPALGHEYPFYEGTTIEKWENTDPLKHWKECRRCHAKKDTQDHINGYIEDSAQPSLYHKQLCTICGWESLKERHKFEYTIINDTQHKIKCSLCDYYEVHDDGGWKYDLNKHWRDCDICGKLFTGDHIDDDGDHHCDVCGKALDKTPPAPFNESNAFVVSVTTNTIVISVYTTDQGPDATSIVSYTYGINNNDGRGPQWQEPIPANGDSPVIITLENLDHNKEYSIWVKAKDEGENENNPYPVSGTTTQKVPDTKGLDDIPSDYKNAPFKVKVKDIGTTLPNIKVEYSTDGGIHWNEYEDGITIDKESVEIILRAKDNKTPTPNYGEVSEPIRITKYDVTPPTVSGSTKSGDDISEVATKHTIVVTLEDEKSGINPGTEVQYAWSTSNTEPPTDGYVSIYTNNTENENRKSIEIDTTSNMTGTYYLWIKEGVKDAAGNKTGEAVCVSEAVVVDNEDVELTNIRMYNPNPIIAGQTQYAKKDDEVLVTFTSNKKLRLAPLVKIGGVTATVTTSDSQNFTAKVTTSSLMPEGELELSISEIIAISGKRNDNTYTKDDLVGDSVIYDSKLPNVEYIPK